MTFNNEQVYQSVYGHGIQAYLRAGSLEARVEKIIYVLKNMDVLKRMPWLAQDAVFQKMASIADVSTLSKEERQNYDENLRKYRDTVAVMQGQWDLGREKGRAEGRAEGAAKEKIEVARKLKSMGLSASDIFKATGLPEEQINSL